MKVFIYRNLNKKCWSVKALDGPQKNRVVAHVDTFVVKDATFKVSRAGRERVLRERRKNVHAGIVGVWATNDVDVSKWASLTGDDVTTEVTYSPYEGDFFFEVSTGKAVHFAKIAFATTSGNTVRVIP